MVVQSGDAATIDLIRAMLSGLGWTRAQRSNNSFSGCDKIDNNSLSVSVINQIYSSIGCARLSSTAFAISVICSMIRGREIRYIGNIRANAAQRRKYSGGETYPSSCAQ